MLRSRVRSAPSSALRSGRAGWRSEIRFIRQLQSSPDPGLDAAEDNITIASRRMQTLGVSAGAARRFTGEGMFRGVGLGLF